ncbi:MAG: Hsp20/alpha crystallin family protein [Chthonomonadales bacterium]|nr:Hsp20/alpha crystallin family protein [Chthonomonadales bacterium]
MTTWNPWREIEALRRELFRATGSPGSRIPRASSVAFLPGRAARAYPLTNVSEDGDTIYVQALAPGLDPDKLELTVLGTTLTISGEKPKTEGITADAYHRTERSAGRFVRSIELPTQVEADNVTARYVNGLLHIRLPRAAAARPRQVSVSVG